MLTDDVARYVALHRGLGLKFDEQNRTLLQFAAYAEAYGDHHVQTKRVYDWCRMAAYSTASWARIPRDHGHDFHAMVGTDSTASWAPLLRG